MNYTFLEENQIFGENQLEIFKNYGTKCAITDYAILTGGYVSSYDYLNDEEVLKNRTGYWWTKTPYENHARAVLFDGGRDWHDVDDRYGGARPALPYSFIQKISSNKVRGENGLFKVECGWYPQTIVKEDVSNELEAAYQTRSLKENHCESYVWYLYKGKRYTRILADESSFGEKLSDGREVLSETYYWVEVEPITYLVDEKRDIALIEKIIFSGVPFHHKANYKGDFESTDIGQYLKNVFTHDVESSLHFSNVEVNQKEDTRRTKLQKLNPDTTKKESRRKMTATERIQNWIESGQSVLLRGPSGIGKTDRIKALYPNLLYIKLTNNMFPEKVVGSMNLQTGESIPPDFAKQAIMACATDEEKKLMQKSIQNIYELVDTIYERSKTSKEKIVILLDELLNVKKPIQSLVYTLVLNKLVEVGGGLKLPANTVIVATGNQKKYSSVAEDVAEPLEKRFDHIFDMEPKVGEWIHEYAIPNKVHPAVIGFILTKYASTGYSEEIKDMGYFYEEPEVGEMHPDKYGCNGRTNDPRGWVSISKTLYDFETDLAAGKFIGKDVEDILKVSLETKLRYEWASAFYNFYNLPTLSVQDVVNEEYTQVDLPRNSNERYACMTSLLLADKNEVGVCRAFIKKYCDPEYLDLYDLCWIGNDMMRMNRILEIKALEENVQVEMDEMKR